jgi:DnaJ-class molecular chaperone
MQAKENFDRLRAAYDVVGEEESKILYDIGGLKAVKDARDRGNGRGGGNDPRSMLFGAGGGRRGGNKGEDTHVRHTVSLEDM